MNDHTIIELAGLVCITVLAVAGLVIDGEVGNSIAIAASGSAGVAVGYVYKAYRSKQECGENEVQ